jgi:hypothetical protein
VQARGIFCATCAKLTFVDSCILYFYIVTFQLIYFLCIVCVTPLVEISTILTRQACLNKVFTYPPTYLLVSFSKTSNSTRPSDSYYFEVFEKLTRACYIQISLETMLLPIQIDVKIRNSGTLLAKEIEGAIWRQFQSISIVFICAANTKLASLCGLEISLQIHMELTDVKPLY